MNATMTALPEVDWNQIRSISDPQAAEMLDARIRLIDAIMHVGFIQIGLIVTEFQERELWRLVDDEQGKPFKNFSDWLRRAAPRSYKTCHNAKTAVKELRGDISENDLSKMAMCNLAQIRKLSPEVRRDPEVIKAAQELEEGPFVDHVIKHHPGQHLDPVVKPTLRLTEPVQAALDLVGALMSIEDRQGQLDALAIDWMLERQ